MPTPVILLILSLLALTRGSDICNQYNQNSQGCLQQTGLSPCAWCNITQICILYYPCAPDNSTMESCPGPFIYADGSCPSCNRVNVESACLTNNYPCVWCNITSECFAYFPQYNEIFGTCPGPFIYPNTKKADIGYNTWVVIAICIILSATIILIGYSLIVLAHRNWNRRVFDEYDYVI